MHVPVAPILEDSTRVIDKIHVDFKLIDQLIALHLSICPDATAIGLFHRLEAREFFLNSVQLLSLFLHVGFLDIRLQILDRLRPQVLQYVDVAAHAFYVMGRAQEEELQENTCFMQLYFYILLLLQI